MRFLFRSHKTLRAGCLEPTPFAPVQCGLKPPTACTSTPGPGSLAVPIADSMIGGPS
ncbi:hypothetical protein CYLTODRAFT_372714 [Cylindrobasidium torrendii FP15055 ss-10]|uniref:Uncharacterized protein n=1 Tax=Cylindrobasidium torrendii FP15055 ss-10 TaxID=1314674 RepID=A0A0D7BFW1_9AGAR|nr:hypothetical protein CYLTODRAFT_372714 [Cylindrobasidium torrendii FP15055 ss-10]